MHYFTFTPTHVMGEETASERGEVVCSRSLTPGTITKYLCDFSQFVNLSQPQLPHLKNEDDDLCPTHILGLLQTTTLKVLSEGSKL